MSQNPLGSYDDDLPPVPGTQPAAPPRDPSSGKFVSPTGPAQPSAEPPAHNPYMLKRAGALGIDASKYSPEALGDILAAVESHQQRAAAQAAAKPAAPPPDPGPDWGEDDQGNKITTEEAALKVYPRAVVIYIKKAHDLEKKNAKLEQTIELDRQQRQAEATDRAFKKLLASRPDLFGDDPDAIAPGSIEERRRHSVANHINALFAAQKQTNMAADFADATAIFGPAPGAKPGAKPPPKPAAQPPKSPGPAELAEAYRRGELPRTSGRNGTETLTRREYLIEQERVKREEANGSTVVVGGDDNDDLPDLPRG